MDTRADAQAEPPERGPCVLCGATNYPLSCGGPSICPSCDCGASANPVQHRLLQDQIRLLIEERDALAARVRELQAAMRAYPPATE